MRAAALGGVVAVVTALVLAVAAAAGGAAIPAGGSAVTPARAAKLGAQAYRYGFPLLEFLRVRHTETSVRCPDGAGDAPVNSFSNAPGSRVPATARWWRQTSTRCTRSHTSIWVAGRWC